VGKLVAAAQAALGRKGGLDRVTGGFANRA
jgi:hypothetical protein